MKMTDYVNFFTLHTIHTIYILHKHITTHINRNCYLLSRKIILLSVEVEIGVHSEFSAEEGTKSPEQSLS